MRNCKTKRIYISSVKTNYCYENIKKVLDTSFLEIFGNKEDIQIVCLKQKVGKSIGEQYAIDSGLTLEYCSEYLLGLLKMSATMMSRRIVKRCDYMLVFRDEELSKLDSLFKYAVKHGVPIKMLDII